MNDGGGDDKSQLIDTVCFMVPIYSSSPVARSNVVTGNGIK